MSSTFKILTALVTALWPLIIFAAIWADVWRFVLPVLAMLMGIRIITTLKARTAGPLVRVGLVLAALALTLCLLSLAFSAIGFMFYYPVAVNLIMLAVFARSLKGKQSIVERLARLQDPDLSPRVVRYTRNVTKAWCIFFVLNGAIAAGTAIIGELKLWTWWNGLLSYGAMGLMFGGEYLLRYRLKAQERVLTQQDPERLQLSAAKANLTAESQQTAAGVQSLAENTESQPVIRPELRACAPTTQPPQGSPMQVLPLATWLYDDRVIAYDNSRTLTTRSAMCSIAVLRALLKASDSQRVALVIDSPYSFALCFQAILSLGQRAVILGHQNPNLLASQYELFDSVLTDLPHLTSDAQKAGLTRPMLEVSSLCLEPPTLTESELTATLSTLQSIKPSATFELYTSGSTGTPKAVLKTVGEMEAETGVLAQFLGEELNGASVLATVFPYHMYGLTFTVFLPWSTQSVIYLPQIHYSEELAALPERRYVLISSPAFLKRLDFKLAAPALNAIVSAGGPLAATTRQKLHAWSGITTTEIYGSTEAGVIAQRQDVSDETPFTLFADVTLDFGTSVTLHSGHVSTSLTLDDRIAQVGARTIKLLCRADRIVKIEENRVSLTAIETELLKFPQVTEAAACVVNRNGRDLIGALLVMNQVKAPEYLSGHEYLELRRQLAAVLEPHALPRILIKVPALPENSMGKRDSRAILALFTTNIAHK